MVKNIFIVGMPRCGSTLLESILSNNPDVLDLSERNIFEESYIEWKEEFKLNSNAHLNDFYSRKVNEVRKGSIVSTNKFLYNYQYAGIISKLLENSIIIHCYRNPLDNILSIYRSNFSKLNEYSSSLEDCAEVYIDHAKVMDIYKKKYPELIYSLNYDKLVTQPEIEIKILISKLGWKWNEIFLSPELNKRNVSTASSVQVRSPINPKSLNGWKNYVKLLKPAMEILKREKMYEDLFNNK